MKSKIHYKQYKILLATLITLLALSASPNGYTAYCSLRDPVTAINTLYPDATHHRSITREINRENRDEISKELPFTLLFNELGKHTLYAIMKNQIPLGFIHARSELTDSGLIEIVWAIDLDMKIKNSYFQRCRNPKSKDPIFIDKMKSLVGNKSYDQILTLINKDGAGFSESGDKLLTAVVKSALKTISITELVWKNDINELKRNQLVYSHFGNKREIRIEEYKDKEKINRLQEKMTFSMLEREPIEIYKITEKQKKIGLLVSAKWKQYGFQGSFHWLFSPDGTVLNITPGKPWPNADIASTFNETIGKNVSDEHSCNTAAELVGSKLFRTGQ